MAKYFARFANALVIRLHVLFDVIFGDSTLRDLQDPRLFLKQCQLIAEHELEMFLCSDLLKCFVEEHEGETHEHVVELFTAVGEAGGRGVLPRRYAIDLTSRKIRVTCSIYTMDSSAMDATEDYYDQGHDAQLASLFAIFLSKMFINNHPCYAPVQRS